MRPVVQRGSSSVRLNCGPFLAIIEAASCTYHAAYYYPFQPIHISLDTRQFHQSIE